MLYTLHPSLHVVDLTQQIEDNTLSVFISYMETLVSTMDARRNMTKHLVLLILTFAYNTRNGDLSHLMAQARNKSVLEMHTTTAIQLSFLPQ